MSDFADQRKVQSIFLILLQRSYAAISTLIKLNFTQARSIAMRAIAQANATAQVERIYTLRSNL